MGHAQPAAPAVRFPVQPLYVSAEKAARMMHLTPGQFTICLPGLLARGFPPADPTTGMFQREAVERWSRAQHPRLFPELTVAVPPAQPAAENDLVERFRAAKERRRRG